MSRVPVGVFVDSKRSLNRSGLLTNKNNRILNTGVMRPVFPSSHLEVSPMQSSKFGILTSRVIFASLNRTEMEVKARDNQC